MTERNMGITEAGVRGLFASFFSREAIADDVANACDEKEKSYLPKTK